MSEQNLPTDETADTRLTYGEWEDALRDGTLLGQRCGNCGHVTGAPKAACARCGSRVLTTTELPTAGEVYTETTLEVVPEDFDGPYQVALVTLGDARLMAHVPEAIDIGHTVELAGTIDDDGSVAPVFEPR